MALTEKDSSQRIKYSFLKILTGSDLSRRRLAMMEASSPRPGPVVWLTGCVHGDEVGGMVVIQEIFKRLRKEPLLCGRLYAFPLMNPIGFETASRHIGLSMEDLNRSFPGDPNGSLAERIAERIFSTIIQTNPTLVLDLHNDWIKSIPYALIEPRWPEGEKEIFDKSVTFARLSGFIVVKEQAPETSDPYLEKSLTGSVIRRGAPAITLELGESFVVNEQNVDDGVTSVWNILSFLGMTRPREKILNRPVPPSLKDKILDYSHRPPASSSGVIRFLVKPGQIVKAGHKVAKIHNVFGKLQETLVTERAGLVLGHSDSSVALPGMPVAAFGLL